MSWVNKEKIKSLVSKIPIPALIIDSLPNHVVHFSGVGESSGNGKKKENNEIVFA